MYKQEFFEAVGRTQRFGLICPEIILTDATVVTQDNITNFPYLFRDVVGYLEPEDLAAQCLRINYKLLNSIKEIFQVPCYYTIGYLSINGKRLFYQSEDSLEYMIASNQLQLGRIKIHAWLTFSNMEIFDISIATTVAVANGLEPDGGIMLGDSDNFDNDYRYHPMIVGEDFLENSGILLGL